MLRHSRSTDIYMQFQLILTSLSVPGLMLFFFFLSFFLGPHLRHMEGQSCRCQPTPQPQQCQILAVSATHTTAHGNARSLTHRARPGIRLATSWFPVGFVSAAPQQELLEFLISKKVSTELNLSTEGPGCLDLHIWGVLMIYCTKYCTYDICL